MSQSIVIIGAGPAGLTAAYELLKKGQVSVTILEATGEIGGISRTKNYKGNRMDIGGHRFFSKSDKAMDFWKEIMPLEDRERGISPDQADLLFLIRHRLSRILFLRKFFDYPVTLNGSTIRGLGFSRLMKIGVSYLKICFRPVKDIDSLEKFFISRFGVELYETFFKDYTEKVWGVPCSQISPDWGAQRVKGLSVSKALLHSLKKPFLKKSTVNGKKVETSLIESFMYPKYGPGQLWEEVARRVVAMGGEIRFGQRVDQVSVENGRIVSVAAVDENGVRSAVEGDYFLSTMPVRDLIGAMGPAAPEKVKEVAEGLVYRDFMTVGLLLDETLEWNVAFPAMQIQNKFLKKYGPITWRDTRAIHDVTQKYIDELKIKCTKSGVAKITVTAIGGGDKVGTGTVMGGMTITKEFAIIARGVQAGNGGWL